MPPKRTPREYRGNSCHRCHKQKVKCSKEKPCRNCALAKLPCTYAIPDRKVIVRESYLKRLQSAAIDREEIATASDRSHLDHRENVRLETERPEEPRGLARVSPRFADPLVENSTAELFVSKLRDIQKSQDLLGSPATDQSEGSAISGDRANQGLSKPPPYEYIALSFDTLYLKCTFKLPPYLYAICLIDQFATYIGHDWHWFRVRRFRQRLEATYKIPNSAESRDRLWLCQLLVVYALSEAFNGEAGSIEVSTHISPNPDQQFSSDGDTTASSPSGACQNPPGMDFFEQALQLLKVPYEEITVEHIEVLNLIALYSYTLNRQRTAYMYAGVSTRMCNVLQLHKKSTSKDCTPVEREHRKRLWWSTFCIDRMASTQIGLLPNLRIDQVDLDYPSQDELSPEDLSEFSDPALMSARAQLTIIQDVNAKEVCQTGPNYARYIETVIRPALQRLDSWKEKLPAHLVLDLEARLPQSNDMPYIRSFANIHLRFNQCMILLLRPLLLRQIECIFSGEEEAAALKDVLRNIGDICLQSARSNVLLLLHLRTCGLLVLRGFMENMHLFSSLMILCLATAINMRRPGSFSVDPDDPAAYEMGKKVLREMIQAGSLPAKGYERMLKEVEALEERIASDGIMDFPTVVDEWDGDGWITQLLEGGNMANAF